MVYTVQGQGSGLDGNLERHLSSGGTQAALALAAFPSLAPAPSPSDISVHAALLKLITKEERKRKVPSFYAAEASGKVT